MYVCVCVCVCIYIYIYIHTHTTGFVFRRYTYIYIYKYIIMRHSSTGYVLRNASLGDLVIVRTSYSVLTQTQIVQCSLLHT